MSDAPALKLDAVDFAHGERRVLDRVSLTVAPGERVAVVGRSGAGKTTLLRLIAGLELPAAGQLELGGQLAASAADGRPRLLIPPQDRRVGFVFQGLALWEHLSVARTLRFAGGAAAVELAARVGLGERLDARPHQLSGGERQRLAIARALASRPALLLLDEPFAHLDAPLRAELGALLLRLAAEQGLTVLLVTHQASDAFDLAERAVVLDGGRFVDDLALGADVQPSHRTTCELLGLGNVLTGDVRDGVLHTAAGPLPLADDAPKATTHTVGFVPPATLRAVADDAGPGRVAPWVIPSAGVLRPVRVLLDDHPPLYAFAAAALPPGARVRLELAEGGVRLLEG